MLQIVKILYRLTCLHRKQNKQIFIKVFTGLYAYTENKRIKSEWKYLQDWLIDWLIGILVADFWKPIQAYMPTQKIIIEISEWKHFQAYMPTQKTKQTNLYKSIHRPICLHRKQKNQIWMKVFTRLIDWLINWNFSCRFLKAYTGLHAYK